jgi:hypothetical protein
LEQINKIHVLSHGISGVDNLLITGWKSDQQAQGNADREKA